MFTNFVLSLRQAGVPASIMEYLALLQAMQAGLADYSVRTTSTFSAARPW